MKKIWNIILDFFFPEKCIGCGTEGNFLCNLCFVKITTKRFQVCPVCKKASYQGKTHHERCQKKTNLDGLLVAATYHENPFLEKSIKQFKYHYSRDLGEKLGLLLVKTLKENNFSLDFVLCPVPLHRKRKIWRGFNQAEVLADIICRYLPYEKKELLARVKNTKQQAKLTREERMENLKNAFSVYAHCHSGLPACPAGGVPESHEVLNQVQNDGKGLKILLVDDVSSTLATLEEAARVLKEEGVREVWGIVLARG